MPQGVYRDTKGDRNVERAFIALHGNPKALVAKFLNTRVDAADLVANYKQRRLSGCFRQNIENRNGTRENFERPNLQPAGFALLDGCQTVGMVAPGDGKFSAQRDLGNTRVIRLRRDASQMHMTDSGAVRGAQHGAHIEGGADIVEQDLKMRLRTGSFLARIVTGNLIPGN